MIRWLWNLLSPPIAAKDLKMRSHHAHRVLVFARTLIEDRRRWTTGVEARTAAGYEVDPQSPDAACFCAFGAIDACSASIGAQAGAARALATAIRPTWDDGRTLPIMVIAGCNDRQGHKAVLAAFDRAIKAVA